MTSVSDHETSLERSNDHHSDAIEHLFDYNEAFSRNIGWITEWEQQFLRGKRVAIAGMGGVGGIHLHTLARLGIGAFNIADLDHFEWANFNRQAGATTATVGQEKLASLADQARAINPQVQLKCFDQGVTFDNLDEFLDGVDLYVDSLDFFVLDIRSAIFRACRERGIPAVTAAPIGMGTGYLVFTPTSMPFETFFQIEHGSDHSRYVKFLLGLTPAMLHQPYLADPSRVDLPGKRGPSTPMACQLCAGVAATEGLKLLLGRGKVRAAPYFHHFDAYRGKFVVRRLGGGNVNPVQRVKQVAVAHLAKVFSRRARPPEPELAWNAPVLDRILSAARFAPSGDNAQPWQFEIRSDDQVLVQVERDVENPYQYRNGEPNILAAGMLVEALRLAASERGRRLQWSLLSETDGDFTLDVRFLADEGVEIDPLVHMLGVRSVQRGALSRQRLSGDTKNALEAALGPGFEIEWHETLLARTKATALNAKATAIRLTMAETFPIHNKVLNWQSPFPKKGLPARGLGLDPLTQRLMAFVMQGFGRSDLIVRKLKGIHWAQLQMDWIPGIFCGAHFVVKQRIVNPEGLSLTDKLVMGQRLMRFWLQATKEGLILQPSVAPLCFADHAISGTPFSRDEHALIAANRLKSAVSAHVNGDVLSTVFAGRLGHGAKKPVATRSLRLDLDDLISVDHRRSVGATGDQAWGASGSEVSSVARSMVR
ncbi:MAG: ThiF family adenylyltransferase [Pseudomonadota bacterium]